jgi:ankyrin repeat protein
MVKIYSNDLPEPVIELESELTVAETPPLTLFLACDCGDLERVRELVDQASDEDNIINKPEKHDRRPLHMAARKGYVEICDILLAHGADLELKTIHGCTALYFAVLSARVEMVEALADGYCAEVNVSDVGHLTPLHIACEKGYADIVKCLLLLGADYTARDIRGRTPLDWAIFKGHKDCITLISPEDDALLSARSDAANENGENDVQASSTVKNTQIALATRNEGVKILKYPFTKENNEKPPNPYKIDIYDVY